MAQDNLWANGQQLVDFNDPTAQATVCSFPIAAGTNRYNGQVPQYSQNAQYDENGKLLFFVVDGNIYDHAGYLMVDNDMNPVTCRNCMVKGLQEMLITRMPGTCDKYYVVGGNKIGENTAYGYGILDLSKPNLFFPGRFGALWNLIDAANNSTLFYQMTAFLPGIAQPQGEDQPSVCSLGTSKTDEGIDGNIHLCILDGPTGGEPPTLFVQLGESLKYCNITGTGIEDEEVLRGLHDGDGLPYSGGIAISKTASDGVVRLARTYNRSSVPEPNFNLSIEISSVTFPGNIVSDLVLQAVNTDLSGTHVGYGTVHGLAFSPNGRYLYFSQATTPYIGYIDMFDPTYAVVDLAAQLGLAPATMSAYGYGQIACNKGPLPNTWSMYFPKASGFGRLDNIDDAPNVTWTATAAPDAGSFSAPPNSVLPSWNHYLMDRQNFREQQIPNLLQQTCCQDNERIPEWSHIFEFGGITTQALPWTPQLNPLTSPLSCPPSDPNLTQAQLNAIYGHVYFEQDFVVLSGARLFVKDMDWRFAPNAQLIIQPGAYVQFDNCVLKGTLNQYCQPRKWPGTDLRGNPLLAQGGSTFPPDQGRMVFNNSTLRDAVVGVTVGKKNAWGYVEHAGGILNTSNSTFLNCRVGVNFYPYQNRLPNNSPTRNRSNFVSTTFSTDANYISPLDFAVHAQFWKVDGIEFMGCTFENQRTSETYSSQLGQGIRSLDAHYKVLTLCGDPGPTPPGQCQNVIPTRFTGLDMGIRAAKATTSRNFIVDGAMFSDNVCGVYANSVLNFEVHNSNFEVGSSKATDYSGQDDEYYWNGAHRGIYSFQSWGFLVDDNTLTNNPNATTTQLEGIVTGYSGAHNDVVFRNHASNLQTGFAGEDICADPSNRALIGLTYLCNTNSGNVNDIWDRQVTSDPSTFDDQTIRTTQGSYSRPADNSFGQQAGGHLDLKNTNYPNNTLGYNWTLPSVPYEPIYYSTGVYPNNMDGSGNLIVRPANNCASRVLPQIPDPYPGPVAIRSHYLGMAQTHKTAYGNTRYLYDQLIDGGSTDETVQEIQSTWPSEAWELRQALLDKSPYLSTDVLFEVVKKNIMPPAMVAEICIANPEATRKEGFLKWLRFESPCLMPQYLIDNIEASWETKTYRTTMEDNLAYQHQAMSQALDLVLASYHADTLVEQVDSIRATWQVLRTTSARYAEILTYLQQDNFDSAYAVMDRLPVEFKLKEKEISEKDRTKQFIGIVQSYRTNGRNEAELTEDDLTALRDLRDGGYDRPGEWAQNILCFGYGECRPSPSGGDDKGGLKAMRKPVGASQAATPALSIFPNPATVFATFAYTLPRTPRAAWLAVRDITGRELARIPVAQAEGQAVWDTRAVAPGTYTVELMNDGASLATVKLVVKP